ncbi:MAG TPA: hypothetical protein VE909_11610 [Xanthobacteraceae bacterium]|nr:hypothetical protein [Xanthobacteraceae bacterium]
MKSATAALPEIPVIDVRDGGAVRHARERARFAHALRDDCLAWFPSLAAPMVPAMDSLARRWLLRSRSPYVADIEAIAAALGFPGIWLLNGSYQWGCTALAREEGAVPWLARTLDWPFPGLGRHAEVARMRGPAGEFLSVTWPGYVGVLTAMAPGRFAAAINQAPLWRRTRHPWLRLYDIAANAVNTWRKIRHMPPDQLLRHAFETCATFAAARHLLETTPIARPVIYTLAGCGAGERCVIERTEEGYVTRAGTTSAANDWLETMDGWEGRVGANVVMTCSPAGAAEASRRRREALAGWNGSFSRDGLAWVTAPVLNRFTRLAVEMCPATGTMRVAGYEHDVHDEVAHRATRMTTIDGARAEISGA